MHQHFSVKTLFHDKKALGQERHLKKKVKKKRGILPEVGRRKSLGFPEVLEGTREQPKLYLITVYCNLRG